MAAAVIGKDGGAVRDDLDDPLPEDSVHAERMDEDETRPSVVTSLDVVDETRVVTQFCR
jgi:hypothetical protein